MRRNRLLAVTIGVGVLVPLGAPRTIQADPPLAETQSRECKVTETSVHPGGRVQVKCSPAWENPTTGATAHYFAADASSDAAGQVVTIGVAAQVNNMKVRIRFRASSTDNPPGCDGGDCRKLVSIALLN